MDLPFQWVITVAVVLACIAFLIQAGFTIAMYKAAKRMEAKVVPLAERAEPVLAAAIQVLEENRQRVAELTTEAVAIAQTVRQQAVKMSELLDETAARARYRITQIDARVDRTVEQAEEVGEAVKGAVMRPVREVSGVLAAIRAATITYVQGGRRSSVDTATQDEEMFI